MKLIECYRELRSSLSRAKTIRKARKEFAAAIKSNNFTMAAQIRDNIEFIICPLCGRIGGL
jgi:protein-arginine kinase activator protein McsA